MIMVCSDDVLHDGILIHSAVKSNEDLCVVERGGASGHNGDRVIFMIITMWYTAKNAHKLYQAC